MRSSLRSLKGDMLENALFGIDSLLANAELGERSASAHNDIGIPAPLTLPL